jgi:hypothetical protein
MSLLLLDGAADGSDAGSDDDVTSATMAFADGPDDQSPADPRSGESHADSFSPAPLAHPAPPLLEVAQPATKSSEPIVEQPAGKIAEQAFSATVQPQPQPSLPEPTPSTARADSSDAVDAPTDKRSEPLPTDAAAAPLAKLPDSPITAAASDWVSGDPSGAAEPAQPAPPGPSHNDSTDSKADQSLPPTPQPDSTAAQSPETAKSTLPISAPASPVVSSPRVDGPATPSGAHAVPEIYSDRVSPNRAEVARQRGGSPGSESAVQSALHWLALHQSSDGRWDADKFGAGQEAAVLGQDRQGAGARADTAVTGLALLAFLGAGNTHQHGDYAHNVQRALEFLISSQKSDGNLAGDAETFAFMYSHGMATLAMSEAYAMTGDKRLQPAVQAAINYTLAAQIRGTGGWRYRAIETPGERGDTSQLGWQLMSLKSAELAGINVPSGATDGAIRFIKSVSGGQYGGKASYRPGERPSRSMTAEALVCRQFLGMSRDNPASDEAGEYVLADLPRPDRINLYYWYYATLGMYQLQGDSWQRWNEALQNALVNRQRTDGDLAGSWDPECIWGGYGGRIYSTALSTLCLEVYYRYLPLYQMAAKPTSAAADPR